MGNEKLTFQDGTVIQPAHALLSDRQLYLYMEQEGLNLKTIFDTLYDPARTKTIREMTYDRTEKEYRDYTELISVRNEGDGLFTAVLRKPS